MTEMIGHVAETAGHDEPTTESVTMGRNPRSRYRNQRSRWSEIPNYQRVLTRYAIERLLYRLSQTEAAEHYVLKGAMLFVTWPEHVFRPTGDLDLLGQGDPDPAVIAALFRRICEIKCIDDGIAF
ncbi:MAG: nucleotidyl transferase AbiEii/AbiGii toxin family protein, partial [Burkholderiales bacterium]